MNKETKEILDNMSNDELLELYQKVEEHIKFLNNSIINESEGPENEQ